MGSRLNLITNIVLLLCCSVLSVLVGVRLWNEILGRNDSVAAAAIEDLSSEDTSVQIRDETTQGNVKAKVAIVEFSDFQCPFCGEYARNVYPQVQREFVNTGRVRYSFRNLPLSGHQFASAAARAAECARQQGRFWEYHDRLFANQNAFNDTQLLQHAEAIGLESTRFSGCFLSEVDEIIQGDKLEAARLRVNSTPTFLVGVIEGGRVRVLRKISGAQPLSVFNRVVNEVIEAKSLTHSGT